MLEAIWSLERAGMDQMKTIQKLSQNIEHMQTFLNQFDFGSSRLSAVKNNNRSASPTQSAKA